jgi:multidrug resistance protein MdtO
MSPMNAIAANFAAASQPSWWHRFWQDQQPTPGRLNSSLRIVLASMLALTLMLALQMPFISIGMYFIFLVARDSPTLSLKSGIVSFLVVVSTVVVELGVVIVSDNDPMARLLSVVIVTFLAGIVVAGSSLPALGSTWGLIYVTVISLWELHAPADRLVKTSLFLLGTFGISLTCAIGVEYIFGVRDPVKALEAQRRLRYELLEKMFQLYADSADPAQRFEAASKVSRLAVAGQAGMMELYNAIVDRNLAADQLPIGSRTRLTMLAELMDVSATFGLQNTTQTDPELRRRCAAIARQCQELSVNIVPSSECLVTLTPTDTPTILDRVESAIHVLLSMPSDPGGTKDKELAVLPASRVPFFIPGALQRVETVAFGLKISLCATLCYILYHALDYPGISTSVITVMVGGLTSSGATNQKLVFRLVGSAIGGLLFGLGATTFLFPHMDSITALIALTAPIAFISAWVAAGPKFSYIGLQIAFSYYIVAFEGFSAPTELAPARDRLIGILLALAVMWFVFDQIWPVRTTTVMRQTFAAVLRGGASLLQLIGTVPEHDELVQKTDALRDRVGKNIAALRVLNDTVEYEFSVDRAKHKATGNLLIQSAVTAAALFWNQIAILHDEKTSDFIREPELIAMRQSIAQHFEAMAAAVVDKASLDQACSSLENPPLLDSPRYAEYVRNTTARFEELRILTAKLNTQL